MLRRIFIVALTAISVSAFAEDYKYLTLSCGSSEKSITLETIRKITFSDGNVVVATSEGTETFPLAEMQKMYFSETATDVQTVQAEPQQAGQAVYDLSGRRVAAPRKGLYISGGKKFVVK